MDKFIEKGDELKVRIACLGIVCGIAVKDCYCNGIEMVDTNGKTRYVNAMDVISVGNNIFEKFGVEKQ